MFFLCDLFCSELAAITHKEINLTEYDPDSVETPDDIQFCVFCGHFRASIPLHTDDEVPHVR